MAMVTGAGNKLSLEHDVGREAAGLDRPSIARLDRIVEIPAGYLRGAGGIGRLAEGNITARRAWIGPRCRLSRRIGKLHITNLPGRNTRRRRRVAHGNDNGIEKVNVNRFHGSLSSRKPLLDKGTIPNYS